ncbi:hybrid sensor histidine kinase/response regulator [Gemmata sp.]|uniref:hybrid sensor histidine kinase/response regulator n=1 Tax=Gemmata sp. TaxID=1914242 RepID=UPI003F72C8BE
MGDQGSTDRAAWEAEMFRLLAENVTDYAIFVVDPHRHIRSWNHGAERLLGFTEGEIVGQRCDRFFTPEDVRAGVPQRELDEALATGRGDDDRWHVRKDGTRFWASGVVTPLRDGGGALRGFAKIMRDRTDLKRAADAAHERERQLRLLTDRAPVLIAHCDAARRYKFVNRPYAARFGLLPEQVVGRHVRDVLGGPGYAAVERHVGAVLAGGRVEFESEVPHAGSGTQTMRCAYDPEFDDAGRVVGFVAAIVNVTEGRRAGDALRESEERLRTLSDNLPDGAVYQVECDPDGGRQFTFISAGVEKLFGVTPAEALADANALYGLVHEGDRQRVASAEDAALRSSAPFDCEFRSWTRTGGVVWVHARSAPRRLPAGQTVWEGVLVDVTARKQADAELTRLHAESERQRRLFDTALSNTTDFNFLFDLDMRVVYANRALLALWGRTADQALGKTLAELDYPPDVEAQVAGNIRRVVETGRSVRDETPYSGPAPTGCYEYILTPVLEAGRVVQVAGSSRDITPRKVMEDTLRDQAERLRDADRKKDEFLATLAHELRNPLAPISNGLHVMRLSPSDPAAVERSRGVMERQLTQLVRLVDDLLDVSRITRGKLDLRRGRVDVRAVVGAAVETSRPAVEQAGHELTVALPDGPVVVDGDAARLAQVVSNLLSNSAKYTPPGGHIRLAVERGNGAVSVSVRDDGVGIPAGMLGRVFEMFTQVDRTLEKTTGGLGIGLSLVKGLVEMHGGTVEARSGGEGRGSEFVVTLPAAGPAAGHPGRPPAGTGDTGAAPAGRRVLVVDDNVDAADSLGQLIELLGHEARTAHDGEAGVAAAEAFRPDVILMDIGMPKLNGYDACRRIRQQPRGKTVIVVAQTGWGQDDDKRKSLDAGFDFHMVKPVDPAALMQLLAGLPPATA